MTGKLIEEEWSSVQPLCDHPLVEIGGHNYRAFKPELLHRLSNKILGSYNGPAWYQRHDALKTIEIIRKRTGKTIRVWRNHMYMHGPWTEKVLASCGIRLCSDGVRRACRGPELHPAGIYNFPLNIIPDHEHLFHAERTPEFVEWWIKRYNWKDDFGSRSYHIDEWTDKVLEGLKQNEEAGIISNMLIHPITLYLCDRFQSLPRILDFLASRKTIHLSEAIADDPGQKGENHAS